MHTEVRADLHKLLDLYSDEQLDELERRVMAGEIDCRHYWYDQNCGCLYGTTIFILQPSTQDDAKSFYERLGAIHLRTDFTPIESYFICLHRGDVPETNTLSAELLDEIRTYRSERS